MAENVEVKTQGELDTDFEQDPELRAMLKVFAALKDLDIDAKNRVLDYVERRLGLQRQHTHSLQTSAESERLSGDRTAEDERGKRSETREQDTIEENGDADGLEGISPIARKWMQRNGLDPEQLSSLYSLGVDEIDLVASKIPGGTAREKFHNVILLVGIASYLNNGTPRIDNQKLKEAMDHYGADVHGNSTAYMKTWSSEISGSRSTGDLTLTTRGLNAAKLLIEQMTGSNKTKA